MDADRATKAGVKTAPARAPVAPHAPGPDLSRAGMLAALQRHAGNQAVAGLLGAPDTEPSSGGEVVQRDLAGDVRGKLEYGVFGNWVITDEKATAALRMLEGASQAERNVVLWALGSKLVSRLLDNLPDGAKAGNTFTQLVMFLGPVGAQPYLRAINRAGAWGWITTGEQVGQFLQFVQGLEPTERMQFLGKVNATGDWRRLVALALPAHHVAYLIPWLNTLGVGEAINITNKVLIRGLFNNSPDTEFATLKRCIEVRFNLRVGGTLDPSETPIEWEAKGLRRVFPVLEALPPQHVSENQTLDHFTRYAQAGGGSASGFYSSGRKEGAMGYGPEALGSANTAADVGDALRGVNRFDKVVRHEVGHAVDERMGWSAGSEPASAARGGWKQYGANYQQVATEMIAAANGGLTTELTATQRAEVIAIFQTAMANRAPATAATQVRAKAWYRRLRTAKRATVMADPAFNALRAAFNNPWYREAGGGPHLGDHIYEESYANDWNRYRHDTRGRKVSTYQYRAPGEWFAEAYAAYYEPDDRGRGAKLNDNDPATKTYFDTTVHTVGTTP
jgi:hypothetical protein